MKRDKLYFEYTGCEAGWIDFTIRYNETKLDYYFSYVYDDPKNLIEWAEKIYNEEYLEYYSDAEGWFWYLNYDGKYLSIFDDKFDDEKNPYNDKIMRLKIQISKDDLCRTLYKALKDFHKSGLYIPREWESITFAEVLTKVYDNSDIILDRLKTKSLDEILKELKELYVPDNYGIENFWLFDDSEYNFADLKHRKEILEEAVADESDYIGYGGLPVMEINSPILERLL